MRSNTTRGFSSIGSGCVGVRHEIVSMYVQRKSAAQVPKMFELSSIASSIDGNVVPWPIFCAMTWSIDVLSSIKLPRGACAHAEKKPGHAECAFAPSE